MPPFFESFLFGLANSLHCAGMCGPLAACFLGGRGATAAYHTGRMLAYATAGVALGGLGALAGADELQAPGAWVAFVLAGALLVFAVTGESWLGAVPGVGGILRAGLQKTSAWSPAGRAALLGILTPLLPCGLLYAIYGAATVSGSPSQGAAVMTGFALGSLPLLFLVQSQVLLLRKMLGPRGLDVLRRAAMLTAAGILLWRGVRELQGTCCH